MNNLTKEEFAKLITSNAKTGQWLNGTYTVDNKTVGIKAYGLWVQRIEMDGFVQSIPEQKTQKAFRSQLFALFN